MRATAGLDVFKIVEHVSSAWQHQLCDLFGEILECGRKVPEQNTALRPDGLRLSRLIAHALSFFFPNHTARLPPSNAD